MSCRQIIMARNITNEVYTSRAYQPGDEYQIVAMYNLLTGRKRTIAEHLWEWTAPPDGMGSIWVIYNQADNTIVGHHGLIPIPLHYHGHRLLMGKTENTLVHPHYRGQILYFLYEKDFLEEAKERFDLLYTTQSIGTPGRIRLKLGYIGVGSYTTYTRILTLSGLRQKFEQFLARKLKYCPFVERVATLGTWLLSPLLMLFHIRSSRTDVHLRLEHVIDILPFMEALDTLWEASKDDYPITIDRNSEYLKWRIFDNPNLDYDFFCIFSAEQLVGYVVLDYDLEDAFIEDLIVANNDPKLFDAALQVLCQYLKKRNFATVNFYTLSGCLDLKKCLLRSGFRVFRQPFSFPSLSKSTNPTETDGLTETNHLLVKLINPDLIPEEISDPNSWYYTHIFSEGLKRG